MKRVPALSSIPRRPLIVAGAALLVLVGVGEFFYFSIPPAPPEELIENSIPAISPSDSAASLKEYLDVLGKKIENCKAVHTKLTPVPAFSEEAKSIRASNEECFSYLPPPPQDFVTADGLTAWRFYLRNSYYTMQMNRLPTAYPMPVRYYAYADQQLRQSLPRELTPAYARAPLVIHNSDDDMSVATEIGIQIFTISGLVVIASILITETQRKRGIEILTAKRREGGFKIRHVNWFNAAVLIIGGFIFFEGGPGGIALGSLFALMAVGRSLIGSVVALRGEWEQEEKTERTVQLRTAMREGKAHGSARLQATSDLARAGIIGNDDD